MQWKDEYKRKLVSIDTAVWRIAKRQRRHRGAVRVGAAGLHVAIPHRGGQGGGRAGVLRAHAQAVRFLHAARDERALRACLLVPCAGLAGGPQGRDGDRHVRAQHAPSGGTGQGSRAPARTCSSAPARRRTAHGYVSLSLGITYEKDVIEAAGTVVLEVNPRLPRTFGDTQVHVSAADLFVEHDQEVPSLPSPSPSETDLAIGGHIAELVEDGSTIQLGIGGIPNAAALALREKHNLGVHTEMMVDSMMELYEMGVVTNQCKGLLKGKFVCCFAMGSRKLYDWLDDNVAVQFERGRWVNDPAVIRQNTRMVSVNTCLMVDLTGQVASESIGTTQYSGTGGQSDTAIGSVEGLDGAGKSIIACYSTAKGGKVSTIVPTLPEGTAVTLHRSNVDIVVTEHGIARLRGRTVRERVRELISVAHPDFRGDLAAKAKAVGYI